MIIVHPKTIDDIIGSICFSVASFFINNSSSNDNLIAVNNTIIIIENIVFRIISGFRYQNKFEIISANLLSAHINNMIINVFIHKKIISQSIIFLIMI